MCPRVVVTNKVFVNLYMFRLLVLHEVGGHVDDVDIIIANESG